MKIKSKLIIITAILLVVSAAVFCIFLSFQLESASNGQFEKYLSELATVQAQSLSDYAEDVVERYDYITAIPAIQKFTKGQHIAASEEGYFASDTLKAMISSGTLTSAVIYDKDKHVVLSEGVDGSVTNATGLCNTEAPDRTAVIFSKEGSKKEYGISVRGRINDYDVGLVFSCDGINNIASTLKGAMFVVDPMNSVASGAVYGGNYDDDTSTSAFTPYKDLVLSTTPGTPGRTVVSNGYTLAYSAASENGWKAVVYKDFNQSQVFSSSAARAVSGAAAAMVVLCIVITVIGIIIVTKPFYRIQETLFKISKGDHDARIDIMSRNEYGDIARVINDIVDNIIVSESRYRTIIDMSDNIIFEWNLVSKEVTFSSNFNKKFSYRAPSEHFADSFLIKCKVHPEDAERYTADLQKLEKGNNFKHNEYRIKNIYGDYIWVLIRTSSILDQSGKTVKIVGVIVDIDRAKKSENILTARASFDSLTNVFNRETIEVAINNEIELIAARKNEFSILFVDIDDFKFFNDQYSHATGDQVLRFTATTIKNAIGDKGMVGRYGGDEFIVCIKDSDHNDPALIAEQLLKTLKEGFDCDSGDHLSINVSIGIAVIKDNSKLVGEIIGQADDAMYKIKKSGKSNFGFLEG